MRFKFKNGNRQCSIEGQRFVADAHGIITIPGALDARASLDFAGDIEPAHHVDTDKPIAIDDMTHDMLVEALVEATKRRLASASLEELRALAASAAGYPTLQRDFRPEEALAPAAPKESEPEKDDEPDEFAAMTRGELFAWLGDHDVKAVPAMNNAALRTLARDTAWVGQAEQPRAEQPEDEHSSASA